MKLYAHPASTTSRPILMFCAEQGVEVENITIDLFSGAHKEAPYLAVNPNGMIPAIDDDGFILSESSAILKYLADKIGSPTYPQEAQARARVNEIMAQRLAEPYPTRVVIEVSALPKGAKVEIDAIATLT